MKKILYSIFLIAVTFCIIYFVYSLIYGEDKKTVIIEKYIYEDALLNIGYTSDEIKEIQKKITETNVNKYLLKEKYESILEYVDSPVFNIENIERYETYDKANDYDKDKVVLYVEIGLDQDFYTNIRDISNYDDNLVLVNKYNKLPDNYQASNLISLSLSYSSNNQKMKEIAANQMMSMIDAANEEGYTLKVISGYRTEAVQSSLFNNSKNNNGLEHALKYSAKPGHSEHQTGLAADINSVEESFANTSEYKWLINNSYKYGFIERYSKGKEFITGYGYEPWHYRYVGIDAAKIIYQEDITLEEYEVLYLNKKTTK